MEDIACRIHRKNVPIYPDGYDVGIECTLVRNEVDDCLDMPEWFGIVAFTMEQAISLAETMRSHNAPDDPLHDVCIGSFEYDGARDVWIEYSDNDGVEIYDVCQHFYADGTKLYLLGADWAWSLERVE